MCGAELAIRRIHRSRLHLPWLQVPDRLAGRLCIRNLGPGAGSDIAADIDYEDLVSHIIFPLVHIIKHFLGTLTPDLIIAGVTEEADADDDIPLQSQAFLRLNESIPEPGAAAKSNNFIFSNHILYLSVFLNQYSNAGLFFRYQSPYAPPKGKVRSLRRSGTALEEDSFLSPLGIHTMSLLSARNDPGQCVLCSIHDCINVGLIHIETDG